MFKVELAVPSAFSTRKTRRRRRRKKKECWHLPHKLGEVPRAHCKAWGLKVVAWVGDLFIPCLCCVCNLRGFAAGCPKDVLACFKKSVSKARQPPHQHCTDMVKALGVPRVGVGVATLRVEHGKE